MTPELITQIFELCIIPLLAILTRYTVQFFQAKTNELAVSANNELITKYTTMINNTVRACVIATNQTYVNSLKAQGKFDKEAQEQAFQQTFDAVKSILSEEVLKYIQESTGDINLYLTQIIEANVNAQK